MGSCPACGRCYSVIESRQANSWYRLLAKRRNTGALWNAMNEFLTDLSADSPLLWALFVLGVVASSALILSVVSNSLIRLGSMIGRSKTAKKESVGGDDVVS